MARILVADDAPAVLEVLDDVRALEGHEVLRATSGQEAVVNETLNASPKART
jgi:CheY-like chemotaxis protein